MTLEEFLKEKGAYSQFEENYLKDRQYSSELSDFLEINSDIAEAFFWEPTPEGDLFWRRLNTEWEEIKNAL